MPCGAPCSRLPCSKRCSQSLSCGHRCPGICGEICSEGYCRECSQKLDNRVDFLEMKTYGEIDIDETPIVVLGCGHFFTAESLDGMMNMSEVYEQDIHGEFIALKDVSVSFSGAVPSCPDCKCPVKQFATQRYNRVINRAVIDEMSRRFLTAGQDEIRELDKEVRHVEKCFDDSLEAIVKPIRDLQKTTLSTLQLSQINTISAALGRRYSTSKEAEKRITAFSRRVADNNQPAQKLHDATIQAKRASSATKTADQLMENLSMEDKASDFHKEYRVIMGALGVFMKIRFVILNDKYVISQSLQKISDQHSLKIPGGEPRQLALPFLEDCKKFINESKSQNLPKMAVEVSLFYATIARAYESGCRAQKLDLKKAEDRVNKAKELLGEASELCDRGFQNADSLKTAIEDSLRIMRRPWYQEVTPEELESIKKAMVSGRGGIATHSGHW